MKLALIDVKYKGKIELTASALKELKHFKTIALYTTTQFNHGLPKILKQLKKNGNKVVMSQPSRTSSKFQILGCDIYHENLRLKEKCDAYLYVGDGRFHPLALVYSLKNAGKDLPVIIYNPLNKEIQIIKVNDKGVQRVFNRRQANIKLFHFANNVGVLVTTKTGQEHFHYVKQLEEKFPKKKFYVFLADTIDFDEMENFPFIQCWVNTACPRIGMEDAFESEKSIVNVEDVLRG